MSYTLELNQDFNNHYSNAKLQQWQQVRTSEDDAAAAKGGGHNNSLKVSPVEGCGLSVRPCLSQAALSAPSADGCGPISPSGPAAGLPQSRLSLRADHHTQTHTVIHSVFQL